MSRPDSSIHARFHALVQASQVVLDRWDSLNWARSETTAEPTADLMHALRQAAHNARLALDGLAQGAASNGAAPGLADEVRRLRQENDRLRGWHASAWQRGHAVGLGGMRRALQQMRHHLDADAWGNTQLTEALLQAEAQRDELQRWRDAVNQALSVGHMVASDDPHESLQRLLSWRVDVALDPSATAGASGMDRGQGCTPDRFRQDPSNCADP